MTAVLKTEIASLAAEAVALRAEQNRHPRDSRERRTARERRVGPVRSRARSILLAYGFLRGRSYRAIEAKCHEDPSWRQVADMVLLVEPERDAKEVRILLKAWAETVPAETVREAA